MKSIYAVDIADELEPYALLDGSELGELLSALVNLSRASGMSKEMRTALDSEMQSQLSWLKANCEIVEESVIVKKTMKRLRFFNED